MSLLNDNITEETQKQIYIITAKLGSVPCSVRDYGDSEVQVNWVVNGMSYMWRSKVMDKEMDWVKVYEGGVNAHTYNILISNLEMNKAIFDLCYTKKNKLEMEFTYESVNAALYEKHPNLSGEWSTLDWNETHATASYILEDGTEEDVLVDREVNVKVSDKLMSIMRDI